MSVIEDRAAITDLVSRLGACLDDHRFDDLKELFAEDVTAATPGGLAEGRDAVIGQATRNHGEYHRIQHLITNVLVDLDGDRAAVRANLLGTFVDSEARVVLEMGGIYRFTARRDGDWRLTSIAVDRIWRTES